MKEVLPHLKIGDKVWALIEEVLDQDILIVNFQGDLVRVNNESKRKFRPGQRIQLKVIAMGPLSFQLFNDRTEGLPYPHHIDIRV